MWVIAFWVRDKGVLAKKESAIERAWMYVLVCTALKLLYHSPEIKAACCWVVLRHCLQLWLIELPGSYPQCAVRTAATHIHVSRLLSILQQHQICCSAMPEKSIRQCDITLNFFAQGIYAKSHIKWFTALAPTNQKKAKWYRLIHYFNCLQIHQQQVLF